MRYGWKKSCLLLALVLCLLLAALPGRAQAAEPEDENYLYYSDIFWGYPGTLTNYTFQAYHNQLQNTLSGVLSEYVYTDAFEASVIELGLSYGTDWGEFAKYLSDQAFGTFFNLNDRIDEANKLIADAFLNVNYLDAANGVGAPGSFLKGLKNVAGTIEKIDKAGKELEGLTGEDLSAKMPVLIDETCGWMAESGGAVAGALLNDKNVFLDLVKTIGTTADKSKDVVDFLKALAVSVAMSDAQLEMIQSIMDTQDKDSMLYRGMSRLQSQLSYGYQSYFISTYLTDEIYKQVTELLGDCLKDGSLITGSATYQAATAVIKLVNWVVFDLVWKVDYNDYAVAVVLYQYCADFSDSIRNQAEVFAGQFECSDVEEYENLYKAYLSTGRAALEHFEKLARHNSEKDTAYLEEARSQLCGADVSADYNAYIDAIRADFARGTEEWRESMKAPHPYTVEGAVMVSAQGTDQVEEGVLYFVDGVYEGDISIPGGGQLKVPVGTKAVIAGDLGVALTGSSSRDGSLYNYGDLEVTGDVMAGGGDSPLHFQSEGDAVLRIGGDLCFFDSNNMHDYIRIGGKLIFNGTEQQLVTGVKAGDVEVTNPAGLCYGSDMEVGGHYDLNGNPLETQGYSTLLLKDATLEPGLENDYQTVTVIEGNECLLASDGPYRFDMIIDPDAATGALTVPEGVSPMIVGDVSGNRMVCYGGLEITGDVSGISFRLESEQTVLRIGGDVSECSVSGGTVIFNGTKQQTITESTVDNAEVANPAGILYGSNLQVNGHYDLCGNPLDPQGYETRLFGDATLEPGAENDYKTVYIIEDNAVLFTAEGTYRCDVIVYSGTLTIPAGTKAKVDGDLWFKSTSGLQALGDLEITGDVTVENADYFAMGDDAVLSMGGDLRFEIVAYDYRIAGGTILFNGTEQQTVSGLVAHNVEVANPAGLRYEGVLRVYGHFDLNGNPLEEGSETYLYENASLEPGLQNDYRTVVVTGQSDTSVLFGAEGVYRCDLEVSSGKMTVPAGTKTVIAGNVDIGSGGDLYICGDLEVMGNLTLGARNNIYLTMSEEDAVLRLGGNLTFKYADGASQCRITGGTLVLNGTSQQTVACQLRPLTKLTLSVLILENESQEGVVFTSYIRVNKLFDHRGNVFTLYDGGADSMFSDYDGDGLLDHVDPEPTVPRKAGAVLENGTVTVRFYDTEGCASVVIAAYAPNGQLLEARVREAGEETIQEHFSDLPENGYLKVFYLAEGHIPWAAMEQFVQ